MRTAANTDFVTNSLATRWTLRRILRPSSIAKGIASKLSFTSTMSATPFAIWLPEPSATATSDSLSAGTSLTPSPTIAHAPAAAPQRLHQLALLVGLDAGEDGVLGALCRSARRPRRQVGAGHHAALGVDPGRARHGRDRAGPSPEITLTSTPARRR